MIPYSPLEEARFKRRDRILKIIKNIENIIFLNKKNKEIYFKKKSQKF